MTVFGRRRLFYNSNTSNNDIVVDFINDGRRLLGGAAVKPEDHRVVSLPGLSPSINLVHYAGHLTVDSAKGGNIFYWLFEHPTTPLLAPLMIWLVLIECTSISSVLFTHQSLLLY